MDRDGKDGVGRDIDWRNTDTDERGESEGPWAGGADGPQRPGGAGREPILNAPLGPLLLVAALVAAYLLQRRLGSDAVIGAYGLSPEQLAAGHPDVLLTSLFLHGGWAHLALNALGALAFGTPVARLLGGGAVGLLLFLVFYLLCGVLSGLGFVGAHPQSAYVVVGASGAVAGLMGAASRLIDRPGRLAPFRSRTVIGMGAAWLVLNLVFGLLGQAPGSGGSPIAVESHLAGYAAGLLLIGPAAALARKITRRSRGAA